jgi:probable F420-dependent oxidoreductase
VKLGLFGINFGVCADPAVALEVARAAEAAGFESVWTGEHVVLPDPQAPPSPSPPETPFLDPAVALTGIASGTQSLRLGTGIIILPQRNPLVLAKELASLDVASNGRLIFGLGAGYLRAEFDALGVSFQQKGARTSEAIEVIRTLWTQEKPVFRGRFWSFSGIQARPHPVQKPHPPIVVGGHSPGAFRRAVAQGDGWYGFALDLERARECIAGLEQARARVERPSTLPPLEIGVTPAVPVDRDIARRFEDLGVARILPIARGRSRDQLVDFVEKTARAVLG